MLNNQLALKTYLNHCLEQFGTSLSGDDPGLIILRELTESVLPSGKNQTKNRRPSISDDGTPFVFSWKAHHVLEKSLRVLVEPGTLKMTIAEQIAYSLTKLDRLLGLLDWRTAANEINILTGQVFPENSSETVGWRGGIWLGVDIKPKVSEVELRIYLNLRHGEPEERWQRLHRLLYRFSSPKIDPFLLDWENRLSPLAVPVGLGIVVANGNVKGVRTYLSIANPTIETIRNSIMYIQEKNWEPLYKVYNDYISRFGRISQHGITVGYDFVPEARKPGRIKVDICCHLISHEQKHLLEPWIEQLLTQWLFKPSLFQYFRQNIHRFWNESTIQFLSLGFCHKLEHMTIYVLPKC